MRNRSDAASHPASLKSLSVRRPMRRPFSAANRRSRISARQGSLLSAGRVRRPRFPHLAFGPHPSRHGSESASSHPPPCQKDVRRGVRRRDRGQRPQLQKNRGPRATTLGPQIRNDYAGKLTSRRGRRSVFRVNSQSCTLGWYTMPLQGMGSRTRSAWRQSDGNRRGSGRGTDRPGRWGGSPAFIHRFF
jgi:hypothetical protein